MKDHLYGLISCIKVQMMTIKTVKAFYSTDYGHLSATFSKEGPRKEDSIQLLRRIPGRQSVTDFHYENYQHHETAKERVTTVHRQMIISQAVF